MSERGDSGSGSTALLGVIIGAVIVIAILFFVFDGPSWFSGDDDTNVDINVDVPAADPDPAPVPAEPEPADPDPAG